MMPAKPEKKQQMGLLQPILVRLSHAVNALIKNI